MTAKISKKNGKETLTVEIPIEVRESASGKTMVIASTRGNQPTTVQYNGELVYLGLNAYYRK